MTDTEGTGTVVESYGRRVVVRRPDGERVSCKLRRRGLDLVAGDEVRLAFAAGDDEWAVVERLPRRNLLGRTDSRGRTEALVANLDQLGVVVSPRPACDPFVVDRYLAGAAQAGIPALIVSNKCDLAAESDTLGFLEPLRAMGLPVISVSARTGTGIDELVARLSGRRSLLAGQSGVGKSSLTNLLAGDAAQATGALSHASGEGRHTTTSSSILEAPWGELVDSPGVRDYAPPVSELKDVQSGFTEIAALASGCRFLDCLHLREPHCAVQAAVGSGRVDARRYESYRRLVNLTRQLDDRRGWHD
ncbi:MAG: ribosome small subunit-dependent GTPase A [Lysobacterales bacterium]|nr:MAG: ribosome small subunit-dependent GTPase A [Xanthomonadales bacterium]